MSRDHKTTADGTFYHRSESNVKYEGRPGLLDVAEEEQITVLQELKLSPKPEICIFSDNQTRTLSSNCGRIF